MYMQRKALFAEVDDQGDAVGGASGGGSPEGGSKSKAGDVVPKTQFLAALKSAEEKREREIASLRSEFETKLAAATAKPAEAPKEYTRAELNALVEARTITQDQADAQMDHQTRKAAVSEASRVATETVAATQRKQHVEREIARYKAIAPEILDDASEKRAEIKAEFNALVALGDDPRDLATQLKAIRAVLGPAEKLERSRNGRPAHESHRESGGGGGEGQKRRDPDAPLTYDDLSPAEKAHYDKGLRSGMYKDTAAVNEELKYANPNIRRKYGAMR